MHIFLLRFILFSVDKRYIFTIDDLYTVAPAYEYFMDRPDLDPQQCWNISIEELSTEKIHQTFCWEIARFVPYSRQIKVARKSCEILGITFAQKSRQIKAVRKSCEILGITSAQKSRQIAEA